MKVTSLQDVEPRPRRVAVGTFDGVHLGHREVIRGADTVLTFEPHPATIVAPGARPALAHDAGAEGRARRGHGRRGARRHPLRRGLCAAQRRGLRRRRARRRARRDARQRGGELPLRPQGRRRRGAAGRRPALRDARRARCWRSTARSCPPATSAGSSSAGPSSTPTACSGAPFTVIGDVAHGDERGRTLGYPTANLVPQDGLVVPGHGVYACRARTPDGVVPAAATNVGVRPMFVTGRGELIEAYLSTSRATSTARASRSSSSSACAASSASTPSTRSWSRSARDVQDARAIAA